MRSSKTMSTCCRPEESLDSRKPEVKRELKKPYGDVSMDAEGEWE